MNLPRLVGMVHLPPLPGALAPSDMDEVVETAVADATTMAAAGFDGVLVENFGDAPFYADRVPPITIAAMSRVVAAVAEAVDVPVGVNVLRNDAEAALAVAAASGGSFIRVNVLAGSMFTDQGLIHGRAAEVLRLRAAIAPNVGILADCFVKHAVPPPGLTFAGALADLWERGGADGVIVSGRGTGAEPDIARLVEARSVVGPEAPLYVGSGLTPDNAATLLATAGGAIVGTTLRPEGIGSPVDRERATRMVQAALAAWS